MHELTFLTLQISRGNSPSDSPQPMASSTNQQQGGAGGAQQQQQLQPHIAVGPTAIPIPVNPAVATNGAPQSVFVYVQVDIEKFHFFDTS